MRAAVRLAYGDPAFEPLPSCSLCRNSPEYRDQFGCEDEAPEPVFSRTCSRCSGSDPACPICAEFEGTELVKRCPRALITQDVAEVMRAYHWVDRGIVVGADTFDDLPAILVDAFDVIDAERGSILEAEKLNKPKD